MKLRTIQWLTLGVSMLFVPVLATGALAPNRTYSATHFALALDGNSVGLVKSVSGGEAVQSPVQKGTRNDKYPNKVPGSLRYEDVVLELPVTAPRAVWDWVSALSTPNAVTKRQLTVSNLNFDYNVLSRRIMDGAALKLVELPLMDGASKDSGFVKLAIAPSGVKEDAPGTKAATPGTKVKTWTRQNFRVTIDGLATARVARVAPIVIQRSPKNELEYSNLSLSFAEADVETWKQWSAETLDGKPAEKSGKIELLTPNMTDVILSIQLDGLGLVRLARDASQTAENSTARMVAELYVEKITFDVPNK